MSQTSRVEYATAKVPTQVWAARPRHIDEVEEDAASIAKEIRSGRAFLKVVAYPWGVEFDVCEREGEV